MKKARETIFTGIVKTGDDLAFTGSFLYDNYRTVVMKMGYGGEMEWIKLFGEGDVDHEGHNITAIDSGILVCGCRDGLADPSGGKDWKAYVMKLDMDGEIVWEKRFELGISACAYSVLADNDYIYLFGEARQDPKGTGFFLLKLDGLGDLIWEKQFQGGKNAIASGLALVDDGLMIGGSHKPTDSWKFNYWMVDKDGQIIWERFFDDICIMDMAPGPGKDSVLMTGSKGMETFLMRMGPEGEMMWGGLFGIGIGISVRPNGNDIVMAGDAVVEGKNRPSFFIVDELGKVKEQRFFQKDGYFEAVVVIDKGYVLSLQKPKPDHHAEIVILDEKGDPL